MCKEEVLAWEKVVDNHAGYHAASCIYAYLKNQPVNRWDWTSFIFYCNIINPNWDILCRSFDQLKEQVFYVSENK